MDLLVAAVRYGLALVLGAAAVLKLKAFRGFSLSLDGFGLQGVSRNLVAGCVVAVEAFTAGMAFAPIGDVVVGAMATVLGVLFLAGQVYLLAVGRPSSCMCFGERSEQALSQRTLLRAAIVVAGGLLVLSLGTSHGRVPTPVSICAAGLLVLGGVGVLRLVPSRVPGRWMSQNEANGR